MDQNQRHKRLRVLISKLNKERRKQAKKIDMLCNDLIAAQRDFIKRLSTISFAADFYKSIIGINDLDRLLSIARKLIKDELAEVNSQNGPVHISFFLRNMDGSIIPTDSESSQIVAREPEGPDSQGNGQAHMPESDKPIVSKNAAIPSGMPNGRHAALNKLENYFSTEVVENICKSNKICALDDMFAIGLQGNLAELNKISAFAIPMSRLGPSLGFILVYRSSENKCRNPVRDAQRQASCALTPDELNKISAITCGLSRAVQSCRALSHIGD
jgi:hypothetical protein